MSKDKAIDHIIEKRGCSKREAEEIFGTVFDAVHAATANVGDRVMVRGFGTFTKKLRQARDGRNPSTGELVRIAEREQLAFKPAK